MAEQLGADELQLGLHFQRLNFEHMIVQLLVQIESYFPNYIISIKDLENKMAKHTSRNTSYRSLWTNSTDDHLEITEVGTSDTDLMSKMLHKAVLGAVQNTWHTVPPSWADALKCERQHLHHPHPCTTQPQVAAYCPWFSSWSTRNYTAQSPGFPVLKWYQHSTCCNCFLQCPRQMNRNKWNRGQAPGESFLGCWGENWDGGRSKKIPPEGHVFFSFTPELTGNLQITHPFPGTLVGKKPRGLTIFLQTHTHTCTHTKEPCKDLNTSCACPCQNFLNPPPFTLACQAMQIFERPPRFRSIWCKNPHQIQAVKAVTHNYSAARNPVRQAKPSYSRRSLEHSLAHLSHWSKECNHSDISCLPSLLKVKCWEAASEWAENRMTQIQYFWEIKLSFASATAETHCADEFCLVTQGLQPKETWVRRPNFSSCLCYCPTVWSWISHFTTPGNKVLLWGVLLGNSLEISENKEETGGWHLQLSPRSGREWQHIAASSAQKASAKEGVV